MSFKPPAREHRYSLEAGERQDRNPACQAIGAIHAHRLVGAWQPKHRRSGH